VNAGATEVLPRWTEHLRPGGRLLVPLTVGLPGMNVGLGHMLLVTRRSSGHVARFVSPIGVFHGVGARSDAGEELLREAHARHDEGAVRSLRWDEHRRGVDCWLHGAHFCLSRLAVDESDPVSA
jgi:protein-L-isoaspartate(D-aspartate) O-methyltransferase